MQYRAQSRSLRRPSVPNWLTAVNGTGVAAEEDPRHDRQMSRRTTPAGTRSVPGPRPTMRLLPPSIAGAAVTTTTVPGYRRPVTDRDTGAAADATESRTAAVKAAFVGQVNAHLRPRTAIATTSSASAAPDRPRAVDRFRRRASDARGCGGEKLRPMPTRLTPAGVKIPVDISSTAKPACLRDAGQATVMPENF